MAASAMLRLLTLPFLALALWFAPSASAAEGFVYWGNLGNGTIGRAAADGSQVNQAFISGLPQVYGVAVDASHIYWAGGGGDGIGTVGRANLDGSGVDPNFITGAQNPF